MQDSIYNLGEVLKRVRNDAVSHRQHLVKNESATRTTLVDPVLRALGWEVANPSMVIVEAPARRGNNLIYADYGLCANDSGVVKFVVEAKALGQALRLHRAQVVDYAFAFNINNVFLTNGVIWEH